MQASSCAWGRGCCWPLTKGRTQELVSGVTASGGPRCLQTGNADPQFPARNHAGRTSRGSPAAPVNRLSGRLCRPLDPALPSPSALGAAHSISSPERAGAHTPHETQTRPLPPLWTAQARQPSPTGASVDFHRPAGKTNVPGRAVSRRPASIINTFQHASYFFPFHLKVEKQRDHEICDPYFSSHPQQ